jgi:hypothetical protein
LMGERFRKVRNQQKSINRWGKPCSRYTRAPNSIFGWIWIGYPIGICQEVYRSMKNISTIPPNIFPNIFRPSSKAGKPYTSPIVCQPQQ